MSTITTAFGEVYTIERRLPSIGWRPRYRGVSDIGDAAVGDLGDADGILAVLAIAIAAVLLLVVVLPLLLFVAEAALLLALVIPLTIAGLLVGVVKHEVIVRRGSGKEAPVCARREVRGAISSYRAKRELREQAESGAFRLG